MTAYERRGAGRILTTAETVDSRRRVRAFWFHCDDARGTPVAAYLARRGLPELVSHPDIRFRADTPHPSGARLPAMIALIWDAGGNVCALHRTYLTRDGTKAPIEPVKATKGAFSGGAIRLDPAGPEIVVGEGLETAASAGRLLGLPAWSAIACGNLGWRMKLPPVVRAVVIAADPDGPGLHAADAAADRWLSEGRQVRIATPDEPGADFNDLLRMHARSGGNEHA